MALSLDNFASAYGIESAYTSETGQQCIVGDDAKRSLLKAMLKLDDEALQERMARGELPHEATPHPKGDHRCFLPSWLREMAAWGVATQLYSLRSARNHGIGDFEDLAQLAEHFARLGADYVGVNPLHALSWQDPDNCSPYSPSSRQFLNPLYIALDRVPSCASVLDRDDMIEAASSLRATASVDYARVAEFKRAVLRASFDAEAAARDEGFKAYCVAQGEPLHQFATFEALSERHGKASGSDWRAWPASYHDHASDDVRAFAADHAAQIAWHKWLQWHADRQLRDAQARAKAAGMRIGLFLDLAVGVRPGGAATWMDPELVCSDAKIGAPPDLFNSGGQDWGLAPMAPVALRDRHFQPWRNDIAAAMRYAGAIRIDHVMGLQRLYWIARDCDARQGGYVRYPMSDLLAELGELSQQYSAIVVGEDLGTVPDGFRDALLANDILGYRVFYFERTPDAAFSQPADYTWLAMSCVATHDLPPLACWWAERDIDVRHGLGLFDEQAAEAARCDRAADRARVLRFIGNDHVETAVPDDAQIDDMIAGLHARVASGPSRLFTVQLEDLAGSTELINLPGTSTEHPNWRHKVAIPVEELTTSDRVLRTARAISASRGRP